MKYPNQIITKEDFQFVGLSPTRTTLYLDIGATERILISTSATASQAITSYMDSIGAIWMIPFDIRNLLPMKASDAILHIQSSATITPTTPTLRTPSYET